jgi:hypothetical protein
MDRWMDGWMDGWMGGWMDGRNIYGIVYKVYIWNNKYNELRNI